MKRPFLEKGHSLKSQASSSPHAWLLNPARGSCLLGGYRAGASRWAARAQVRDPACSSSSARDELPADTSSSSGRAVARHPRRPPGCGPRITVCRILCVLCTRAVVPLFSEERTGRVGGPSLGLAGVFTRTSIVFLFLPPHTVPARVRRCRALFSVLGRPHTHTARQHEQCARPGGTVVYSTACASSLYKFVYGLSWVSDRASDRLWGLSAGMSLRAHPAGAQVVWKGHQPVTESGRRLATSF